MKGTKRVKTNNKYNCGIRKPPNKCVCSRCATGGSLQLKLKHEQRQVGKLGLKKKGRQTLFRHRVKVWVATHATEEFRLHKPSSSFTYKMCVVDFPLAIFFLFCRVLNTFHLLGDSSDHRGK